LIAHAERRFFAQDGIVMNNDVIKGKWKQIKGRVQSEWGKLTNDDLDVADGHREYLVGKVQERYGWKKDEAEEAVKRFERAL
jgi:uncharacterized protein YjbJ (UPF0337 family)